MTATARPDTSAETVTMPHGKALDVHRPAPGAVRPPVVLLWHGVGPDERDVMRPLAEAVAREGLLVLVPDWRSDEPDGGRAQLLASLEFARARAAELGGDPGRFVLAGWSAGGSAAVGVALRPDIAGGPRPAAVVSIASRYDLPNRTTGTVPLADLADLTDLAETSVVPISLVHGTADALIPAERSQELRDALAARHWPVLLEEPVTDHAGVIMTEYDPAAGRCRPSEDPGVLTAGRTTARTIARAAGRTAGRA
ncbi:alpha/beta hydrolase [Streptomyces hesseae]|uniref:Alpha/beta hydrolase n=1 Tax=Streptomyces hesseae TaxID=3075519 RepID=A0ABU2SMM7_9ACTN|nr:alpha/beta hydrolase fold domain-containing protein [Streptomyces sp. DSM 40473]MDT0449315.1 alpha/beta hydrolase [Streptomyces sp. DSM 40473]